MNFRTSLVLSLAAIAIVALGAVGYDSVVNAEESASEVNVSEEQQGQRRGPRLSDEDRASLDSVIASRDYAAWKAFMEEHKPPRIEDLVTEENFDQFAQMHELRREGNHEEARALAEELGLPMKGKHEAQGEGRGFGKGSCGQRGAAPSPDSEVSPSSL